MQRVTNGVEPNDKLKEKVVNEDYLTALSCHFGLPWRLLHFTKYNILG